MKSIRLAITAICLTLSPHNIVAEPEGPPFAGTLKGFVRDARTQNPIAGANVRLIDNQETTLFAMAQEDGSFSISGIPPGTYVLNVGVIGYWFKEIPGVVVRSGQEVFLPDAIMLNLRPPTSGLTITFPKPEVPRWIGSQDPYPCNYSRLSHPYRPAPHSKSLSADELDILVAFYREIALPWIFTPSGYGSLQGSLPIRIWTWSGGVEPPDETFFTRMSTSTLRAVPGAVAYRETLYCMLTINQWVGRDTVEVEAMMIQGSRGSGRAALATRAEDGWAFCLNECTMSAHFCGEATSTGSIFGIVRDAVTGRGIPNATIKLLGTTLATTAMIDGSFAISTVTPGVYKVGTSMPGYLASTIDSVVVRAGLDVEVAATLRLSGEE